MRTLPGVVRSCIAALGAAGIIATCGACNAPREVRYGSLVAGQRSRDYGPGVQPFSLPNGLTVALVPDGRANLVSVDVRYQVGAADDPPGKAGLAHLVEHMMFEQRAAPDTPTIADRLAGAALYHQRQHVAGRDPLPRGGARAAGVTGVRAVADDLAATR